MAEVLAPQDAPTVLEFVTDFDNTYNSFMTNYDALLKVGPIVARYPEIIPPAEYDRLVNEGAAHYNKLNQLKATRDYAASWLDWFYKGAQGIFNWFGSTVGLNGLGIIPLLIPIGAAVAALAIIGYYVSDLIKLSQRTNLILKLESEGRPAAEITSIVNGSLGKMSTNLLGIPFELIIYGLVAIFLGPPIIRALTGGRD